MMETTVKKRNGLSLPAGVRTPHEVRSLVDALLSATRNLVDDSAVRTEREEMYAVFDEASLSCAYALLCIGLARYASRLSLDSREEATQIFLLLRGTRRLAGKPLCAADILPEAEATRAFLYACLRKNGMEFTLEECDGVCCLSIAVPRFLSERYDVCAVDAERVLEHVYDMMLMVAGREPKTPRTLSFD